MRTIVGLCVGFAIGCARIKAHDALHALGILLSVLVLLAGFGIVAAIIVDNRDAIRRALRW